MQFFFPYLLRRITAPESILPFSFGSLSFTLLFSAIAISAVRFWHRAARRFTTFSDVPDVPGAGEESPRKPYHLGMAWHGYCRTRCNCNLLIFKTDLSWRKFLNFYLDVIINVSFRIIKYLRCALRSVRMPGFWSWMGCSQNLQSPISVGANALSCLG